MQYEAQAVASHGGTRSLRIASGLRTLFAARRDRDHENPSQPCQSHVRGCLANTCHRWSRSRGTAVRRGGSNRRDDEHPRRRAAGDRRLSARARRQTARRAVADDPDAHAVRQVGQQGGRRVLCRARLRLRRAGHARPLQLGGRLAHAHRRRPRRLRHLRVDRPAAVVRTARSA